MRKTHFTVLILLVALFILPFPRPTNAQLADSPWPMFHGNSKLTGLSPYDTSHIDGTIKWTYDTGTQIETSPVIGTDGTIYLLDHKCNLHALDPDGSEAWRFNAGEPVTSIEWGGKSCAQATPAIAADGTIYILPMSGNLFAINPDGTEKWKYPVWAFKNVWTSPSIGPDGTIYVGSEEYPPRESGKTSEKNAFIYAINPDGTLKWEFDTDSNWSTSVPSIGDDGTVYTSTNECLSYCYNIVIALNPEGSIKWKFAPPNGVLESSISIGKDGTLYFGTKGDRDPREATFYALNPDGKVKWTVQQDEGSSMAPAIAEDGTLYLGDWGGKFFAFNPDGTTKWLFKTPAAYEALASSPAIGADGTIYFGSTAQYFFALNSDGTKKWSIELENASVVSSPAIGPDGIVYFTTVPGTLYAIGGPDDAQDGIETQEDVTAQHEGNSLQESQTSDNLVYILSGISLVITVLALIIFWRRLKKIAGGRGTIIGVVITLIIIAGISALVIHTYRSSIPPEDANQPIVEDPLVDDSSSPQQEEVDKTCPHHVYGTEENGFYGAYDDFTTKDLTPEDIDMIKTDCTDVYWPG